MFLKLFLSLVFILSIILLSPIFLYRILLSKIAQKFKPNFGKILSPQSSLFATHDLSSHPEFNINVRLKLSGKLDFQKLSNILITKCFELPDPKNLNVKKYPEFKQIYTTWMGYQFWTDEKNFSYEDHIKHIKVKDESEVKVENEKIINRGFCESKSPWEITFIEIENNSLNIESAGLNLDQQNPEKNIINVEKYSNFQNLDNSSDLFFVSFKVHHSLGDGTAIYNALMSCADFPVKSISSFSSNSKKSCISSTLNFFLSNFFIFISMLNTLQKLFLVKICWNLKKDAIWGLENIAGSQFSMVSENIYMEDLKKVRSKFQCSVTAVLLALVTGAMRRKLDLENQNINKIELLEGIRCIIPIYVKNHPKGMTNKILFMDFTLPVHLKNCSDRVKFCEEAIRREKKWRSSLTPFLISNILGSLPKLIKLSPPHLPPVAISILPGPLSPVTFNGAVLQDISYAINGNRVHSFLLNIMSYNGKIRISIRADSSIFRKQEKINGFNELIFKELNQLLLDENTHNNSQFSNSLV